MAAYTAGGPGADTVDDNGEEEEDEWCLHEVHKIN